MSTGYEKLKTYGFYVHGGIDDGANFVVYATLALNKEAESLMIGYRSAVRRFGRPQLLCSITKPETLAISNDMEQNVGPGAHIQGRAGDIKAIFQSS